MKYTATRVVAALTMLFVGWAVSQMIMPLMREGTAFGMFAYLNAAIGAAVGWVVIGSRMGRGMANAIGVGFTAAVVLVFWGVFLQAAREMVLRANKRMYDGPMEAAVSVFQIGIDYLAVMATPTVVGALAMGGIVSGILAEKAAQSWR